MNNPVPKKLRFLLTELQEKILDPIIVGLYFFNKFLELVTYSFDIFSKISCQKKMPLLLHQA